MLGGLIPGIVALAAAWLLAKRRGGAWFALAAGIGYAAGHLALFGMSTFKSADAMHRLLWIALATAAVSEVERRVNHRGVRWALNAGLCAATPVVLLWPILEQVGWLQIGLLAASLLAVLVMIGGGRRVNDPVRPVIWVLTAIGAAMILKLTGSSKYGELGAAVTACIAGATLIAWFRKDWPGASSGAASVTLLIGALLILGYYYSSMPLRYAVLLAVALLLSSSRLAPQNSHGLRRVGWPMRLTMSMILILLAVAPAVMAFIDKWNATGTELPY